MSAEVDRSTSDPIVAAAWDALTRVMDPCSIATGMPLNIVDMGLVRGVDLAPDGSIAVEVWLTSPVCTMMSLIRDRAQEEVGAVTDGRTVNCHVDVRGDWRPSMIKESVREERARSLAFRVV